ncbi:MAG TPA: TlpA disulfide reductase family protein [Bryobacteraceae bacterium]|jgi:peroxiredoxin
MRFSTAALLLTLGLKAFAAAPVPRPAPELNISDPAGKHILLSQYKGKVVLIQFLLTTCPHCQAMSRMVTTLQEKYGPRGFQALGAAVNTADPTLVKNYVTEQHVGFPVGAVPYELASTFLVVNERLSFPQVVIIDRKGQIQAQSAPDGTEELQDQAYLSKFIEKLLGTPPAAAPKKAAPATPKTANTK